MTTETVDATETILEQLEAQIVRLPAQAQLKLVANVTQRLSSAVPEGQQVLVAQKRSRKRPEVEALLKELDAAAEWVESETDIIDMDINAWIADCEAVTADLPGPFDSAADIRRMRNEA